MFDLRVRWLSGLLVVLAAAVMVAGETPPVEPAQDKPFMPQAALDAQTFNRRQELQFVEREAAERARLWKKANEKRAPEAAQLRRELQRLVATAFDLQQAEYRAENDQLRARIAAVDRALSRREETQTAIVEKQVERLLSDQPAHDPPIANAEDRQRELFGLLVEAARIRQRVRQLQFGESVFTNLPDMAEFRQEYGFTVRVEVVGRDTGNVWGTDTYSDDSDIATAAVHAGLLAVGEKGLLIVKIVPSPPLFEASTRHGVTSREYKAWASGYVLAKVDPKAPLTASAGLTPSPQNWTNRGQLGDQIHLEVVGATDGPVWGTDLYTLDSDLATAAVHAGVLQPGEQGWIVVTLVKSAPRHHGSLKHGVASRDWGPFAASFYGATLACAGSTRAPTPPDSH